jgi:NADPH2:quinone reductase
MLQGMTVHYLTHSTYALKPGDTCLIHAAAGGVGLLFVQIAKMRGATVIGTCSTEEKAANVRAAGADHVILYGKEDFVARVKEITGGKGVEAAYDGVGQSTWEGSLNRLPRGMLVCFGTPAARCCSSIRCGFRRASLSDVSNSRSLPLRVKSWGVCWRSAQLGADGN